MKNYLMGAAILAALLAASASQAQEPEMGVNGWRHSNNNLIAAQSLTTDAIARLTAAQRTTDYRLIVHAARARDLLQKANVEMRLATDPIRRRP